jgi:nucleoside-diphosphate-sugar epimerase
MQSLHQVFECGHRLDVVKREQVPALTLDKARGSLASGWWCDDAKARADLGWSAEFDLERGLEDTIRWLRDHGHL